MVLNPDSNVIKTECYDFWNIKIYLKIVLVSTVSTDVKISFVVLVGIFIKHSARKHKKQFSFILTYSCWSPF